MAACPVSILFQNSSAVAAPGTLQLSPAMAIFVVGVADAVCSTRAVVSAGAAETIFTTGVLSRNMGNRRDTAGVWVSKRKSLIWLTVR